MKTSELTGAALDWAVAKAEGYPDEDISVDWNYSTDWAQAGPIIEREGLQIWKGQVWNAAYGNSINPSDDEMESGPTPLVAAMRCYVASKLGAEVNIPEEIAA